MAVDHNGRACLRETARNGCANVLSRSGNDRDASVEVCLVHGRHQRAPLLGLDILRYSMREHRIRRRTGSKCEILCASRCFPLRLQTQTLLDAIGHFAFVPKIGLVRWLGRWKKITAKARSNILIGGSHAMDGK